jgi:hypothetical protein
MDTKRAIAQIRCALFTVTISFIAYYTHKYIQREYYYRCTADIVQVIFFRNSSFCVLIRNLSSLIESAFLKVLNNIDRILIDALKN